MSIAWEKVVMWILAIALLIVLVVYMVHSLANNPDSVVGKLFTMFGNAGKTPAPTPTTP